MIAIVGLLSGLLVGVGIPVWQNYWVEKATLIVEISSISRIIPNNVGVFLDEYQALEILKPFLQSRRLPIFWSDRNASRRKDRKYKPDDLLDALKQAKKERTILPKKIEDIEFSRNKAEKFANDELSLTKIESLSEGSTLIRHAEISEKNSHPIDKMLNSTKSTSMVLNRKLSIIITSALMN